MSKERKPISFIKIFFASLLAIFVSLGLIFIIFFGMINAMMPVPNQISKNTVLHLKLNSPISDLTYIDFNQTTLQLEKRLGLKDILVGIESAKTDKKVKGIFINVADLNTGMANVKEIRDALEDFKSSGKFLVAYNENYTKKGYYLSSVADEVYVFPSGLFDFLGLGIETMFLKGALEKLDVKMQIIRGTNNKFKSAVEPLMYEKMSDANREQTQKYLDALWNEMLKSIEKDRGVSINTLNEIADSVYIRRSAQAVDYKLADGVKYYDEILEILAAKSGVKGSDEVELYPFSRYAIKKGKNKILKAKSKGVNIAVVFAEGEIVDGNGKLGQIGGNSMSALIREAREDSTIKAVVLRVNSPGGSALASDIIWREIILTKQVKPVIVSMGNVAASGGYYISCGADKIYAQPNTITGSIGVFGVIPFTGDLLKNKLGITIDRVQTNAHSIMSFNKKLTEEEFKIIQQGVDDIYDDFISKVGEGRGMSKAEVDSIGQGRVWAGTDAINIGLVDAFGGLNDAIADAAERVNIPKEDIKIKVLTTIKTDKMMELIESFSEEESQATESKIQQQLMEMYHYVKQIENHSGIQARLPYLFWID
ncbi:MAG TPA: signal peptide peptidase SppA [Crocinitomix sp.]|nr:signal peptide peptidase SppA [Crocinitomix sp.]